MTWGAIGSHRSTGERDTGFHLGAHRRNGRFMFHPLSSLYFKHGLNTSGCEDANVRMGYLAIAEQIMLHLFPLSSAIYALSELCVAFTIAKTCSHDCKLRSL